MAEQQIGEVRIYAEKKLPKLVFKPSKTKKNLPVNASLQDPAWGRLFDYTNNYQSVLVAFFPTNSERAVAGIGLQYSHESHYFLDHLMPGRKYAKQMAATLTVMRGRPYAEEAYRSTLHAFQWISNHADCYDYLKTSAGDMAQQMDKIAAETAVLRSGRSLDELELALLPILPVDSARLSVR